MRHGSNNILCYTHLDSLTMTKSTKTAGWRFFSCISSIIRHIIELAVGDMIDRVLHIENQIWVVNLVTNSKKATYKVIEALVEVAFIFNA